MRIAEIFYSIQGEGELTGVPSVFVRTAGCDLRCRWCDTPYAAGETSGAEFSVDQVLERIAEYPARHCVLTGGEPMLAADLPALAAALRARGRHITIETNATHSPNGIACDLASLSPKLSNSRPADRAPADWREQHEQRRWRPTVAREWIERYPYQLKFVVATAADVDEIQEFIRQLACPIPPEKVFLMPEGTDPAVLRGRDAWLVACCKQHGYRYCRRLQIELFGNQRGV